MTLTSAFNDKGMIDLVSLGIKMNFQQFTLDRVSCFLKHQVLQ